MYLGTESCFFYGFLEIRQINNQKPYYIHKLEILDSFQCRPFKNGHFVRVCTEKMKDHQYKENGAKNICSNHNQMRAYIECSKKKSIKKLYLINLSIEQSTKL